MEFAYIPIFRQIFTSFEICFVCLYDLAEKFISMDKKENLKSSFLNIHVNFEVNAGRLCNLKMQFLNPRSTFAFLENSKTIMKNKKQKYLRKEQ